MLAPVAVTPVITLDNFEVITFNGKLSPTGTDAGRVLDLYYVADPDEDIVPPTVD